MYRNVKPTFRKQDTVPVRWQFSHESDLVWFNPDIRDWEKNHRTTKYTSLFAHELLSMYHCLARQCNEIFGTAFPFSEELIRKLEFYRPDPYWSKGYNVRFLFRQNAPGHFELLHHYWYEGFRKDRTGIDGISTATYGEYDQKGITAITEALRKAMEDKELQETATNLLKK